MLFVIYVSRLSLLYLLSCLFLKLCDHCWERTDLLALLCAMFPCVFVTFPYGASGQVWYLILSIPERCLLYFYEFKKVSEYDQEIPQSHTADQTTAL